MRFQQIGPAIGIQAFGSEIEQTARLHHPVQKVEDDTHRHNSYRHPAFTFQQERKNKGPLKIVQLKQQEEEIYRHGKSRSTLPHNPNMTMNTGASISTHASLLLMEIPHEAVRNMP